MDAARTPVVLGVGQAVERGDPVAPLELIERAARVALEEAEGAASRIERLTVVSIVNGGGRAPASALARRLGLEPPAKETTTIGGNTPQWLVTRAAAEIAAGDLRATLIAGGEAVRSQKEAPGIAGDEGDAPAAGPGDPAVGDGRPGLCPAELAVGLMAPAHVYPLFESVIAHRAGRSFLEHRSLLGEVMAPLTEVAAKHPCAWFPEALTPEQIAGEGPDNRLVAEPYTKKMSAHIGVDQAAALVVTSLEVAEHLGLGDRAVFVHSGADAHDVWFPVERPDPGRSPGIEAAGRSALTAAGIDADHLGVLDLYSCFPCAVEMSAEALGLALDDPRGLTVTGGLPYFGGPGNNYTAHAIATLVERLREQGGHGLVAGLGWFATKHSVGVYGAEPPARGFRVGDTAGDQAGIDATTLPVAAEPAGRATVDAATVIYDRAGGVSGAPVIATLEGGERVVAAAHKEDLPALRGVNLVGAGIMVEGIMVEGSPPRYRVEEAGA